MFDDVEVAASAILVLTVCTSLIGLFRVPALVDKCLFRPYYLVRRKQYATIVTSGLVHADIGHLLFNMFTFYFFAFPLEKYIGSALFLMLYLTGLIASHGCTFLKQRANPRYASLGASGAISAVLFAYIVFFPTTTLMIIPIPVPIPAVLFAVGYVGYSYWASTQSRGRINHDAHLCGALSGLGFAAISDPSAIVALLNLVRL